VAEEAEREPGLPRAEDLAEDVPELGDGEGSRVPVQTPDPCVGLAGTVQQRRPAGRAEDATEESH